MVLNITEPMVISRGNRTTHEALPVLQLGGDPVPDLWCQRAIKNTASPDGGASQRPAMNCYATEDVDQHRERRRNISTAVEQDERGGSRYSTGLDRQEASRYESPDGRSSRESPDSSIMVQTGNRSYMKAPTEQTFTRASSSAPQFSGILKWSQPSGQTSSSYGQGFYMSRDD